MCKIIKIICALFIFTYPAIAQNEIDHINTLWPSGYGKLALDGDTLYVNTLNGHGVERYYIADPSNPVFIGREEVSGFDQIDFQRRLMAKAESGELSLVDFADFDSTRVAGHISLLGMLNWKLAGNYLFAVSNDDSIRTYSISDINNPTLVSQFHYIEAYLMEFL